MQTFRKQQCHHGAVGTGTIDPERKPSLFKRQLQTGQYSRRLQPHISPGKEI